MHEADWEKIAELACLRLVQEQERSAWIQFVAKLDRNALQQRKALADADAGESVQKVLDSEGKSIWSNHGDKLLLGNHPVIGPAWKEFLAMSNFEKVTWFSGIKDGLALQSLEKVSDAAVSRVIASDILERHPTIGQTHKELARIFQKHISRARNPTHKGAKRTKKIS